MLYRFQPARLLTPVLLFAGLCAFSYWLNPEPWHHITPVTQATFAVALLAMAALMLFLRNRLSLRIDQRGIEVHYPFKASRLYLWDDIESAHILRKRVLLIPVLSSIGLKLSPAARPASAVLRAASVINGYDTSFPAYFDLTAPEILGRIAFYKSQTRPT